MSANVRPDGNVRLLGLKTEPDERVTTEQLQDKSRTAELLMRMLRAIAALERRWAPPRVDFEDRIVRAGGSTIRLEHRMGGRVRYAVVSWASPASPVPILHADGASDPSTLVLRSYASGVATIRIEKGG